MQSLIGQLESEPEPRLINTQSTAPLAPPLLELLWRRRTSLGLTLLLCLTAAALYTVFSTRVYRATAMLGFDQNASKPFNENTGYVPESDGFLQTQADIIRSAPVLARALGALKYQTLAIFSPVQGDPVAWLRNAGGLKVEIPKRRSDTLYVSIDSPYPSEAATIADQVVSAYLIERAEQNRASGQEMLRVLQKQKDDLNKARDGHLAEMARIKREHGVLSFRDEPANTGVERAVSLARSVTTAEIATMELRAQQRALQSLLDNPESLSAFVTARSPKDRGFGDQEYDELRRQLAQYVIAQDTYAPVLGINHPYFKRIELIVQTLKVRVAEKYQTMAQAQLAAVTSELAIAEEKEKQLRGELRSQQAQVLDLTPVAGHFAKAEGEVERIARQLDQLERRISEVNVNRIDARPLDVQVLESARVADAPVKPRKALILAAGLLAGCLLGLAVAMLREWRDTRLRDPREVVRVLGTPVVAMVPRINLKLSPMARGQMVRLDRRSLVAEAYRSACTSLHLGVAKRARTILVTSPAEGEGKSTTASNLAIAFAQAGERTLLLDCDMRQPVQHLIFDTAGESGLTSAVSGESRLRDAIYPTEVAGLHLCPCGPLPSDPVEFLSSKRLARVLQPLLNAYDRIVIDSPPLDTFADARILAAFADATLLVLRMNHCPRELGVLAMDDLAKVGANVLGAVANDVPVGRPYRKYDGSWQYAASRDCLLIPRKTNDSKNRNGNGNGNGNGATAGIAEVIVAEPDWSTDTANPAADVPAVGGRQ
jgi:succinoglycan biosynthesis transport protein ExoP